MSKPWPDDEDEGSYQTLARELLYDAQGKVIGEKHLAKNGQWHHTYYYGEKPKSSTVEKKNGWLLCVLPREDQLGGLVHKLPVSRGITGKLQLLERDFGEVSVGGVPSARINVQNPVIRNSTDFFTCIRENIPALEEAAYALRLGHILGIRAIQEKYGTTFAQRLIDRYDEDFAVNPSASRALDTIYALEALVSSVSENEPLMHQVGGLASFAIQQNPDLKGAIAMQVMSGIPAPIEGAHLFDLHGEYNVYYERQLSGEFPRLVDYVTGTTYDRALMFIQN